MPTPAEVQARVDEIDWFHSIELGDGVVTKGKATAIPVERFPDFAGKSVLDIGAWDGYYSFLAERCGASRVVALDHYAWGLDWAAREAYWDECRAQGRLPDHDRDTADFWLPDLPGRRGFDLARQTLHSAVEPVVADFASMDLDSLGSFDVVLYLGVLYHMKEPLTCLERLRRVTREVAVIETAAVAVPGYEDQPLLHFHAGDDLNRDFGNWYSPNVRGLHALCTAAGFSSSTTVAGAPPAPPGRGEPGPGLVEFRAIVHALP